MRKSIKVFGIIICVLAVISVIGMLYMSLNSDIDTFYKVEVISDVIALLLMFVYLALGFSKDLASYYKIAMYVNAINALIVTAVASNEATKYISVISCAISFGCIFTLAIAKNLGKKVSLILCSIVLALRLLGLISCYLSMGRVDITIIVLLSQNVLALVVLAATIAKYEDKALRNTK